MRLTAISLLLLFTSLTVVLSTYFLWDEDDKVLTIIPIEEEEDHQFKRFGSETPILAIIKHSYSLDFFIEEDEIIYPSEENSYEDVHLIKPYSPPDDLIVA